MTGKKTNIQKKISLRAFSKQKLTNLLFGRLMKIKERFLIVLDNANELIKSSDPAFPALVNEIITNSRGGVKFLISSHFYKDGFD
jgi:AAA+ ATPase superfamily predicted ATPase